MSSQSNDQPLRGALLCALHASDPLSQSQLDALLRSVAGDPAALRALAGDPSEPACATFAELAADLEQPLERRRLALCALGASPLPAARAALRASVTGEADPTLRLDALRILAEAPDAALATACLEVLATDPVPALRALAERVLRERDEQDSPEALRTLPLEHPLRQAKRFLASSGARLLGGPEELAPWIVADPEDRTLHQQALRGWIQRAASLQLRERVGAYLSGEAGPLELDAELLVPSRFRTGDPRAPASTAIRVEDVEVKGRVIVARITLVEPDERFLGGLAWLRKRGEPGAVIAYGTIVEHGGALVARCHHDLAAALTKHAARLVLTRDVRAFVQHPLFGLE